MSSVVIAVLLASQVSASAAAQQPSGDAGRLVRQAEHRIRELQAESERLAHETKTLLGELRALELERSIKAEEVRRVDAQLTALSAAVAETSNRLARLKEQQVAGTPGVQERLVEVYKRGRGGYVRLLVAADDLRALGRMSRGVAAVARLDQMRFEDRRRTIRATQDGMTEFETRRIALRAAQTEASRARQALDRAVAAHNRRIDALDQRRDLAARYAGELQQASNELQRRVSGMNSQSPAALPLAPFRGALEWPVAGRVASRFGRSQAGRFGTAAVRNGIEIATAHEQPVRAVHGGTVEFAAPFMGFGTLVILDHGDEAFTLYGHLGEVRVTQGTRVERGEVVGLAGRNPEGAQVVYFEVRIDGRPVDPVQWLRSSR